MELSSSAYSVLCKTFGTPDIDMFASSLNKKCKTYVSWRADPEAHAVDALTVSWSGYNLIYCFPPFSLIGRVLQKAAKECKMNIVIVYPEWHAQSWYPVLQKNIKKKTVLPQQLLGTSKIKMSCGII